MKPPEPAHPPPWKATRVTRVENSRDMQQFITITFQSLWQVPNPLPGLPKGNSASIPQACVMMFVLMLLHFVFRMFARFKVLFLAHQSGMQLACPRHLGRFCIDVIRESFVSNFCSLTIIFSCSGLQEYCIFRIIALFLQASAPDMPASAPNLQEAKGKALMVMFILVLTY